MGGDRLNAAPRPPPDAVPREAQRIGAITAAADTSHGPAALAQNPADAPDPVAARVRRPIRPWQKDSPVGSAVFGVVPNFRTAQGLRSAKRMLPLCFQGF